MSIQSMAWALAQTDINDSTARYVLLCLANYANEDGRGAFPAVSRLSSDSGLSVRTIRYKLDFLESIGAIKKGNQAIAAAYIDRHDRRPTVYDMCIERGAADAGRSERGAYETPAGCSSSTNGVQTKTERGAGAAANPSLIHQDNPSSDPEDHVSAPAEPFFPRWFEVLYAAYPSDESDKLATLTECARLLATGHKVADLMAAVERYTLAGRAGGTAFMTAQEFFSSPGNIAAQWGTEFEAKPAAASAVVRIFDHWKMRMNHPGSRLDDKRRKLIAKALKLGYTEENLIAAIDGCAKSAYHMGQNDSGKVYDSIDLIFRSADKIDGFIKTNSQPIRQGRSPASSKERFSPAAFHARQEAMTGQVVTGSGMEVLTHE